MVVPACACYPDSAVTVGLEYRKFDMTNGSCVRAWLIIGLLTLGSHAPAATSDLPEVGKPAPNFQVTTFDGTKLTLADFKGQVVVLNFWATWCGPCKQELPLLDAYYRGRQQFGLKMLAVATEDSLTPSQLAPVQKVVGFPMVKRFKGDYGKIRALPTNVVIDRAGIVRYAKAAMFTLDDLNELLIPLLNEHAPEG
jgi:cytochrome c biogenesis protein CcmG/thiol:disulfide interchange protein DsbE